MPDRLPIRVNPYKLAEAGKNLQGLLSVTNMGRLRGVLIEDALDIATIFAFFKDGKDYKLHAEVEANPVVSCQRCLQPMTFSISSKLELVLVETEEQAERILQEGQATEPCIVAENALLELSDLIEDEILLSLPSYPKHEHDCSIEGMPSYTDRDITSKVEDKQTDGNGKNPFSVLEKLKS